MRCAGVALALLVALLTGNGCYTVHADLPGTWRRAAPDEDIVVVGRVDQRHTHFFLLFGLVPQPARSMFAAPLLRAVEDAGADGVANVVVDSEFTATDALIRGVTLGIVSPRSYRVRADIVRIPGAPPPGRPLLQRRQRGEPPPLPATPTAPDQPRAPPAPPPQPALAPDAPPQPLDPVDPAETP